MKILFLDFDGPLVTLRSHFTYAQPGEGWRRHDPLIADFLVKCCKCGDVKIVVSSTWRMHPVDARMLMDKTCLSQFLHEDWHTPIFNGIRGDEIKDWLDRHPEVTSYRILDDDSDMLKEQLPFLIKAHPENGVDSRGLKELLEWVEEPMFGRNK